MIADDEADQSATSAAFSLLHTVARQRLARGRSTVIDATNVESRARRPLIGLARRFDVAAVAIVFDLPADVVRRWNTGRTRGPCPPTSSSAIAASSGSHSMGCASEGFEPVWMLDSPDAIDAVEIGRSRAGISRS